MSLPAELPPIGTQFGAWTVKRHVGIVVEPCGRRHTHVVCECKCGRRRSIRLSALMSEGSVRCRPCATSALHSTHGASRRKPDRRDRPRPKRHDFVMYLNMIRNSRSSGVPIDPRWLGRRSGFLTFKADLKPPRKPGFALRRIDTDRGYVPDNVRIVPIPPVRTYPLEGIPYSLGELEFISGINRDTLAYRLDTLGLSAEAATTLAAGRRSNLSRGPRDVAPRRF